MQSIKTVAVSACLLGENCKYNGGNNRNEALLETLKGKRVIPICPEVLGGLPTPRLPSEIVGGEVKNARGESVHAQFVLGAQRALEILEREHVGLVILQSRSPSCGVKQVYDGSFSGKKIPGQGIFAAMAMEKGYQVMDIEEFELVWSMVQRCIRMKRMKERSVDI